MGDSQALLQPLSHALAFLLEQLKSLEMEEEEDEQEFADLDRDSLPDNARWCD